MNKVFLIGNLGRDPETRYTPGGDAVTSFSVATVERWTGKDGKKQEKTEWHNVTAWRKLGEICGQYLAKGSKVMVEGKIETQSWEKDGEKKYRTIINASNIEFLTPKKEARREPGDEYDPGPPPATDNDDIPF